MRTCLWGAAAIAVLAACGQATVDPEMTSKSVNAVTAAEWANASKQGPNEVTQCYGYGCPRGTCQAPQTSCSGYAGFSLPATPSVCPSVNDVDFCLSYGGQQYHVGCTDAGELDQLCTNGCIVDPAMGCTCCATPTHHGC